jgi:hypothetical protein
MSKIPYPGSIAGDAGKAATGSMDSSPPRGQQRKKQLGRAVLPQLFQGSNFVVRPPQPIRKIAGEIAEDGNQDIRMGIRELPNAVD